MKPNPKPEQRPINPNFSSGPCAKRPGWTLDVLNSALVGRAHRARESKQRLRLVLDKTHRILELPADYRVAIVPGSDTGAFEMALWTMLGARGVDVLSWDAFGKLWVHDIVRHLTIEDTRVLEADYGRLPDLSVVDFNRDVVFAWNGTTSGVRVPRGDWIRDDRRGLTFVDATSAVFAQDIDWAKVDVATFSWQKVFGGEAAHGMIILSPRAVERLESHVPPWPVPKVFRLTKAYRLIEGLFKGETINTPSMLCVEDYLDALRWGEGIGGLAALQARADANAAVIFDWIEDSPWIANLAVDPATRSNTSVCLRIDHPAVTSRGAAWEDQVCKQIAALLNEEGVAKDIGAYRAAPPGLRIWCGSTVERSDLDRLTPWLDWAFTHAVTLLNKTA
ncbi:MAG: phosphoserine transaminase [Hyphomicrobium sp.]